MFASCGNFRGLNCPFYALGSGTCRRPYCHFRHVRNQAETERLQLSKPRRSIDDVYPQTADVSNYVFPAPSASSAPPKSATPASLAPTRDAPLQYVPTPIAQISLARRRHKMAARASRKGCKKAATPTYIPTPLAQIAAPPGSKVVASCKYQLNESQSEESDDTVYDPMKTKLLKDVGVTPGKYSLDRDPPSGKDEYDPFDTDNLLSPRDRRENSLQTGHPDGSASSDLARPSAPEGSEMNVSSSKYRSSSKSRLQDPSERVSILPCDPQDDGICSQSPITGKEVATGPTTADEDGLYDFDDLATDAKGDDEYDPVDAGDEIMSSGKTAEYTPTAKYSMRHARSEPGNVSEYDPFSNFSSETEAAVQHSSPKTGTDLAHSDAGESSEGDSLMIVDETDPGQKPPSSDEEPASKKRCTDSERPCSGASEEGTSSEVGAGKAWMMSDATHKSFLADISFQPLSHAEKAFIPSYSYSPGDAPSGNDSCDSGGLDWSPAEYLTHLSAQKTDETGKDGNRPTAPREVPAGKSAAHKQKSRGAQERGHGVAKRKSASATKVKNTTTKTTDSSKAKALSNEKQVNSVKNQVHSNEGKPGRALDKTGQADNADNIPAEKAGVMPVRPKVSSDQLSKFFDKMSESKTKKANSNTERPRTKQTAKLTSKRSDESTKLTKSHTEKSAGDKNVSGTLTEQQEQGASSAIKKQGPEDGRDFQDCVIVIESSSSSEDGLKRPPLASKRNGLVSASPTEPADKPALRLASRKASTQLLFGEDSDSDNSDLELVQPAEDEICLISDGNSSAERRAKANGLQHHRISERENLTTPARHQDKDGANKTPTVDTKMKTDGKKDKSVNSLKTHHGKKNQESHRKATIKEGSGRNKKTSSVRHKPPHSPLASPLLKTVTKSGDNRRERRSSVSSEDDDGASLCDGDIDDNDVSFSESDTFEECLRIFQEDSLSASIKEPQELQRFKEPDETKTETTGKQRVAHVSKFVSSNHRRCTPRPMSRPTPMQVCHNRYMQALAQRHEWQSHEQRPGTTAAAPAESTTTATTAAVPGGPGKRIAHVAAAAVQPRPNSPRGRTAHSPSSLSSSPPVMGINAKIQLKYSIGHSASPAVSTTVAISAPKGERRIAHLPKKVNPRPLIPPDMAGKVPSNIRQRYLNLFIDEFLKTAPSEQDAFEQGLKEEKGVYERATSKNIYLNLSVNTLTRLRSAQSPGQSKPVSPTTGKASISHEAVIGGKPATQHTYTLNRSHSQHTANEDKYEGAFLYERLKPYLLGEDQLVAHGYPRPSETPGLAVVKGEDSKATTNADPNQHVCSRCGKTFLRRPDGHYITRETCTYHWGKFWHKKVGGSVEGRFNCCSGTSDEKGCCTAKVTLMFLGVVFKYHVTEDKSKHLTGFMRTVAKLAPTNGNPGLYALDCEMCYTVKALELTRVTVVDDQLKCVYDTLVKPSADIVDYNTRFSGITEDDLKCVSTTLQDVQAVLLSMFSSDSILIGHSLESDMLALKMIHSTVVDTAVLFPHRRGLPFKRALRTLMAECLNRIIQNDVGGHDSKEDARSCMELIIWKAKQDIKKWTMSH